MLSLLRYIIRHKVIKIITNDKEIFVDTGLGFSH